MDKEQMVETWTRLAREHAKFAQMLVLGTGNMAHDLSNASLAADEMLEAKRCLLLAERMRESVEK